MPRRVSLNVESGNVVANLRSATYAVSAVRLGQLRIITFVLTFKVLDGHPWTATNDTKNRDGRSRRLRTPVIESGCLPAPQFVIRLHE